VRRLTVPLCDIEATPLSVRPRFMRIEQLRNYSNISFIFLDCDGRRVRTDATVADPYPLTQLPIT
jgi:hypothetical protein